MFTAGFSTMVGVAIKYTRGPAGFDKDMVDLISCDTIVGVPRDKVMTRVLEACTRNCESVCRSKIDETLPISTPVSNCKLANNVSATCISFSCSGIEITRNDYEVT